jgi:hypothetical protein
MHLTNNLERGDEEAISTAPVVEAGAPAIPESVRAALEEEFSNWFADNSELIDYASSPDVVGLLFRLNAAFTKALSSSCETPKAS